MSTQASKVPTLRPVQLPPDQSDYQVGKHVWIKSGRVANNSSLGVFHAGIIEQVDATHLHIRLLTGNWIVKVPLTQEAPTTTRKSRTCSSMLPPSLWNDPV